MNISGYAMPFVDAVVEESRSDRPGQEFFLVYAFSTYEEKVTQEELTKMGLSLGEWSPAHETGYETHTVSRRFAPIWNPRYMGDPLDSTTRDVSDESTRRMLTLVVIGAISVAEAAARLAVNLAVAIQEDRRQQVAKTILLDQARIGENGAHIAPDIHGGIWFLGENGEPILPS